MKRLRGSLFFPQFQWTLRERRRQRKLQRRGRFRLPLIFGTSCRDLCKAELSWLFILCESLRVQILQWMHLMKVPSSGLECFKREALNSSTCFSFLCRNKVLKLPNVWKHQGQHLEKSINDQGYLFACLFVVTLRTNLSNTSRRYHGTEGLP